MLKSRAVTISFRFYVGLSVAALVGAVLAAAGSETDSPMNRVVGPLSAGWKGGIGDHVGYTILLALAISSAFLGILFTAFRDADPTAEAQAAQLDSVPLTRAPVGANYWPIIGMFALATTLIGLAISSRPLALAGAVVIGAAAFMWTVRAWAERATGDDRTNLEIYQQVVEPLRLPLMAVVLVGIMVVGLSRLLLTLPNAKSSAAVFAVVGIVVLLGAVVIAFRPKLSKTLVTVGLLVFGLLVIAGGIVGAARGSRTFEHHEVPVQEQPAGGGG